MQFLGIVQFDGADRMKLRGRPTVPGEPAGRPTQFGHDTLTFTRVK